MASWSCVEEPGDLVMSSDTLFGHFGRDLACCALRLLRPHGLLLLVAPADRRAGVQDFLRCMAAAHYVASERAVRREGNIFHVYELQKDAKRELYYLIYLILYYSILYYSISYIYSFNIFKAQRG